MDSTDAGTPRRIVSEAELLQEFTRRAQQIGLTINCLGSGNINAEIVVIGSYPGQYEEQMKMPMVGPAGRLLWDRMREIGIQRNQCYVTNVCKKTVQGAKDDEKVPIAREELAHWEGLLDWELDQLDNVRYVVVLGALALHAITGDFGITKWRGSILDVSLGRSKRTVKAFLTFNPAAMLHESRWEGTYKFDFAKFGMVLAGTFKPYVIKHHINPSFTEAIRWIDKMQDEKEPISFDIETIANETACIGLANEGHEGTCISFRTQKSNTYSASEEIQVRTRLSELFTDPTCRLIAQNGNFDSYWLWYKDRIRVRSVWFDTLLAHHTLYPRLPHNLGFLTAQYTTHPYYKDEGKDWKEKDNIDQFWDYNVKDACITWACHKALLRELEQQKLDQFFFRHVMRLQPHLVSMTVGGVLIDHEWKKKITEELGVVLIDKLRDIHHQVQDITGDYDYRPNPRAHKQLSEMLFKRCGLVGHGSSSAKVNRDRIRVHPRTTEQHIRLLDTVDEYLTEAKFNSTYAKMRVDDDGRIRCEYKQYGVQKAPGRLSSAGVLWGTGGNLQNIPHRAYPMFIMDEGYMASYFDLRQAEARCVAFGWNVGGLIENFELADKDPDQYDIHRLNAQRIFRVPYDEIPKSDWTEDKKPTRRYLGKRCVHGLNYRMLAPKLAEVCKISISMANEAWSSYHKAFPEIQRGWDDTIKEAKQAKMLYSWFQPEGTEQSRRLIIMEQMTDELLEPIVAFRPQSTIGDKVSSVIYSCENDEAWPKDARFLLNIHDALVAIHRFEDKRTVQLLLRKHAESPLKIRGQLVRIPADIKETGEVDGYHRWSSLESLELE